MAIEYKTEGKVLIECKKGNVKPVALTWIKGNTEVLLHQGGVTIHLSPSQLNEIKDFTDAICHDLKS